MRKARTPLAVLVSLLVFAGAASATEISKLALVTIELSTEINAPAAKVWSALTDASRVQRWCPIWTGPPLASGGLDAVGRSIPFRDEYGNEGVSIVLHVEPARELRIAHVPESGSYLCQTTIHMTPKGRRVAVTFTEQYSDQLDVPIDRDTAVAQREGIRGYLAALKTLAEEM